MKRTGKWISFIWITIEAAFEYLDTLLSQELYWYLDREIGEDTDHEREWRYVYWRCHSGGGTSWFPCLNTISGLLVLLGMSSSADEFHRMPRTLSTVLRTALVVYEYFQWHVLAYISEANLGQDKPADILTHEINNYPLLHIMPYYLHNWNRNIEIQSILHDLTRISQTEHILSYICPCATAVVNWTLN